LIERPQIFQRGFLQRIRTLGSTDIPGLGISWVLDRVKSGIDRDDGRMKLVLAD
jgi:hypothetical protein